MEVKRVLVPVNGDPVDEDALRLACDMVQASRGIVYVLYVIEMARSMPVDAEIATATTQGELVLQHMERVSSQYKCKVEAEMLQARKAGPAVVKEALARDAQLVVLGMSYKKRYGIFTLGNTVPHVLKNAPCRVLVLREDMSPSDAMNASS